MQPGWQTRALALSVALQVTLWKLPHGALLTEAVALLAVTGWSAAQYLRGFRDLPRGHRTWRGAGVAGLSVWFSALVVYTVMLLGDSTAATRIVVLAGPALFALGCGVVALVALPGLRLTGLATARILLDGLAVGLSLTCTAWGAVFGLGRVAPGVETSGSVITLTASLLVLFSAAAPLMLSSNHGNPTALTSYAAGIAVMAAGVATAVFAAVARTPDPELMTGGALFFGALLVGRAATLPTPEARSPGSWESPSTRAQAVPFLVLLLLVTVVTVHQAVSRGVNLVLVGMLFLLAVSVLTRQYLSLRVNARLAGELTRQRAQLSYQAFHDPLTGLANRALFAERLATALRLADRPAAVLLVDLDGFKAVNDVRGHAVGDGLLRTVAWRIQSAVRSGDTVARMGGDEFAVLLPGASGEEAAAEVAERILERVARPVTLSGNKLAVRASIGVALRERVASDEDQSLAELLLRDADLALYRAKQEGKNRFCVADRELAGRSLDRMRLEEDLRRAVDRDEFEVHYQPVVDLARGTLVGAEALLRWRHPTRGLLVPADFLDAAVAVDVLPTLDRWVVGVACRDAATWRTVALLSVSVNVCAASVAGPELVTAVADALLAVDLGGAALELEVTETAVLADAATAEQTLRELAALGVGIVLDDFGTGYSSLTHLRRVPIQTLKLDGSFVRELDELPSSEPLARAILGLAETLNLRVVAEGVERPAQVDRLLELGCGFGQGYLFGMPVPVADLIAHLVTSPMGRDGLTDVTMAEP